jgi:starch phosphorylase
LVRTVAYFSMEIALEPGMPTYSGGLGVLAGDTIRAAADARVPMVGVSLLHRKGYFYQRLDRDGRQTEEPVLWSVDDFVRKLPDRVSIEIGGRSVEVGVWEYEAFGADSFSVPVYFLDADLPENAPEDRRLTDQLYGGDEVYRFSQEALLGIGGLRMLRKLGHESIEKFHMNEGHSSLLALELVRERLQGEGRRPTRDDVQEIRQKCVFTTHTPVPAGHDKFPMELVERVLGRQCVEDMRSAFGLNHALNMTDLALTASHYVNGVAKKHGEVSRQLFPNYRVDWITNGVHAATWTSPPVQKLFDHWIPGWREDNFSLRSALGIPGEELWQTHREAKWRLLEHVNRADNVGMDLDVLTIGFARRATPYKRPDLLFSDLSRLREIAKKGKLQLVFAGKAHPRDEQGKKLIASIFSARRELGEDIKLSYLENYDLTVAKLAVAGVDVWLNTPESPLEASGTSGMKAALNGVPSLSVLDGWWVEGCVEGLTGWSIGHAASTIDKPDRASDAASLYDKLENEVLPSFYGDGRRFVDVMRHAIALNGAYFNTQRMMQQYVLKAYFV